MTFKQCLCFRFLDKIRFRTWFKS